ncbi:MAG: GGDEF domain-containing protein [Pseudomonadota bacterium]
MMLYRWSTSVQVVSDLMIAIFFFALMRTMQRRELRPWLFAWLSNLAALAITVAYWLIQPASPLALRLASGAYPFTKTLFIMLLIVGALGFAGQKPRLALRRRLLLALLVYALMVATFSTSIPNLGYVQSTAICLAFAVGAWLVARTCAPGARWLAAAFAIRATFAAFEALAYGAQFYQAPWASEPDVANFLASHSSFDTAAEWMIVLASVLMMYGVIAAELTAAQGRLQYLAERDPLTGLINRRSLLPLMRSARESGATILFFDLDDFKAINDVRGHQAGDACLKRFALALLAHFRPSDHVIRFAGDEFIVIAPGAHPADLAARIENTREQLALPQDATPALHFSVGVSVLEAGGDTDQALRQADEAMYREKRSPALI